ncbi:peptidoglycan-binding protein [Candidatus Saccharibacteria bacterium]|nr:peptidoglycan-binding protein [Candidatus Saccharibacteria bacterium]
MGWTLKTYQGNPGITKAFPPNTSTSSNDGGRPTLRRGSKGEDVKTLQKALNSKGANLDVDGDFGPLTEGAVRRFQNQAGIKVDGIVGPQTWGALGF